MCMYVIGKLKVGDSLYNRNLKNALFLFYTPLRIFYSYRDVTGCKWRQCIKLRDVARTALCLVTVWCERWPRFVRPHPKDSWLSLLNIEHCHFLCWRGQSMSRARTNDLPCTQWTLRVLPSAHAMNAPGTTFRSRSERSGYCAIEIDLKNVISQTQVSYT